VSTTWAGLIHALHQCSGHACTFAAYRIPGEPVELIIGDREEPGTVGSAVLDTLDDRFIIAPFQYAPERTVVITPEQRFRFTPGTPAPPDLLLSGPPHAQRGAPAFPMDRTAHANAIGEVQRIMADGVLRKAVIARTINLPFRRSLLPELFAEALDAQPSAFVCLVQTPSLGIWLGASPERLIQANDGEVEIDSIAGTLPASESPEHASDWGAKEREEQAIVTHQVGTVLAEQGFGPVHVEGPGVLRSAQLAHLHSTLRAARSGASLARLVARLHPTPAVCGTPTELARSVIERVEHLDRGLYAGFWGPWRMNGRTLLHVNIRCMRVFADSVDLYVGGGITAASQADNEWQETEHKARTWSSTIASLMGRVS
jgi:isochorismate synthase